MGLFSISPAQRFLDSAGSEDVYAGCKQLVFAFFRAMQAQQIYFKYGMHPLSRELMMKHGIPGANTERFGTGGQLLSSIGDDEEMCGGDERILVQSPETAAETCATRMARLKLIPGASRGISFGIETTPDGPAHSWGIVLHRGPLPLLEIELSDLTGFHPPRSFRTAMLESHAAHIISGRNSRTTGRGDYLFLLLKRWRLFPYSKGSGESDSVLVGNSLRRVCHETWQKLADNPEPLCELSNWNWRRKRFVRKFDRALLEEYGADDLDILLKRMGTRLESWLAACET